MYVLYCKYVRQHLTEECVVCYALLTTLIHQTNHKEKALDQIRANCSHEI